MFIEGVGYHAIADSSLENLSCRANAQGGKEQGGLSELLKSQNITDETCAKGQHCD